MKKDKKDIWFKVRRYPHIGKPILAKDKSWVIKYVKSRSKVAQHSFYPFIRREIKQRKFRKKKYPDGSKSSKRYPDVKVRPIHFASHLDANIYSYYSFLLNKSYEEWLKRKNLSNCVTAYRKIKVDPNDVNSRGKSNIHFANDLFEEIRNSKLDDFCVVLLDIKSFFTNLNHSTLKTNWKDVIGAPEGLPEDHYAVYKNITKYSEINEKELFNKFKKSLRCRREDGSIKRKYIKKKKYMIENDVVSFCYKEEYRRFVKRSKLINKQDSGKGIPQGSPISAILANIYLMKFDQAMLRFSQLNLGIYRRYSDDIALLIPTKFMIRATEFIYKEIKLSKLNIQPQKTQVFKFIKRASEIEVTCIDQKTMNEIPNQKFSYLGFEFDGEIISIKASGLSSFYRKMKRSTHRARYFNKNGANAGGGIYKSRLYKRFSRAGKYSKIKYSSTKDGSYTQSGQDWGNYFSYAERAAKIMGPNIIKRQLRRAWKNLSKEINK